MNKGRNNPVVCPVCHSININIKYIRKKIYVCNNCYALFKYPPPLDSQLQKIYQEHYSPKNIEYGNTNQAVTTPYIAKQILNILKEEIDNIVESKIIEIGAGLGDFGNIAKEKFNEVLAVEKNTNAREYIKNLGIKVIDAIDNIDKDNIFDLAVMIEVIEHLKDPVSYLKKIFKLLKTNGRIFITTPNSRGLNSLVTKGRWRGISEPSHLILYSPKTLYALLSKCGFRKIRWIKKPVNYGNKSQQSIRKFISEMLQKTSLSGGLKFIATK